MGMAEDFEAFAGRFLVCAQRSSAENDVAQSGADTTLETRLSMLRLEGAGVGEADDLSPRVLVLSEVATVVDLPIPVPADADAGVKKAFEAINGMRGKPNVSAATWWLTFVPEASGRRTTWRFDHAEMEDEKNARGRFENTEWVRAILVMVHGFVG